MGKSKTEIQENAEFLKAHFVGRGWFVPGDVCHGAGMGLRELCGALNSAQIHGIGGCTILHDTEAKPPRWIIIEGDAPEIIQRECEKPIKQKTPDWSFLCKPWPLVDFTFNLEERA